MGRARNNLTAATAGVRNSTAFNKIMGSGRGGAHTEESLAGAASTPNRYVVRARVKDAVEFEERLNALALDALGPETNNIAPDFDLCKAPSDEHIEFYVNTSDPEEAHRQFLGTVELIDLASDLLFLEVVPA